MAMYGYKVLDKDGKTKKGSIEANSQEKASDKLKSEGYTIVSLGEQGALDKDINFSLGGKKVKSRDLSVFCKQFVSVLNAGVTIISALEMLSEQMPNKNLQRALREAQAYVEKGGTLSEGFKLNPKVFPPILINMVAAGEASGSMEVAFERLSTHFEKDSALKNKIKGALTYPIVVCIVAIGVVIVMMVMVIPTFADMFADMGVELPLATRIMIALSDFLLSKGWALAIIVGILAFLISAFKKTSAGDQFFSTVAIKMPLFGNLTTQSCAARFSRTLSTLMASGIPLLEAIEQVARMMGNKLFRDGLMDAKVQVSKGMPLSKPLREMELFPPMLIQMVKIGEETGNIESMMEKVADYYDDEVDLATSQLTAMMEPLTIVVLAVVVGGIVAAVYGPMLSMYEGIDNM